MASARKLEDAMHGADFVLIDGMVFSAEYLRAPDEFTVPDDVLMELRAGDTELAFTHDELADAVYVGDGAFRLKSGSMLRFLVSATVH